MDDEVLAVVGASPARRWIGVFMLASLGGLVIYVAFVTPPEPVWQTFLVAVGVMALWMAERMFRATEHRIELTETELRTSDGQVLARVSDIVSMDRGMLAIKPSNGFMLKTKNPGPRAWRPGLWWRIGRRVGVGGVTSAGQTKAMSEILSALQAVRSKDDE